MLACKCLYLCLILRTICICQKSSSQTVDGANNGVSGAGIKCCNTRDKNVDDGNNVEIDDVPPPLITSDDSFSSDEEENHTTGERQVSRADRWFGMHDFDAVS